MSAEGFSREQVRSLQKQVAQLLETNEFCLFFPNDDGRGIHSMMCSQNPPEAAKAIRKFLNKHFPE